MQLINSYVICMPFVCHPYVKRMYSYVTRMYSCVICFVLFFRMSSMSYVTRMCSYIICIYSYVIRMSLVCTRMSSVCHSYVICVSCSYVFVCHPCVNLMYSYVIHMSLVCGFTVDLYYMQMFPVNRHNTVLVQMELSNNFQLIIYFSCLENVQKSSALTIKLGFDEIWTGSFSIVGKCITGRNW